MTSSDTKCSPMSLPREGRLLGLDYGRKRIGIAVSTPEQTISSPLEVIARTTADADARRLKQIAADHRVVGLVVGLPVLLSGFEGSSAHHAREFGEWAAQATALPLLFWDEQFSSALADDVIREAGMNKKRAKASRDMLAAQAILQNYLDSLRPPRVESGSDEATSV